MELVKKSFNGLGVNLVLRWLVITQAELGEKKKKRKNIFQQEYIEEEEKIKHFLITLLKYVIY